MTMLSNLQMHEIKIWLRMLEIDKIDSNPVINTANYDIKSMKQSTLEKYHINKVKIKIRKSSVSSYFFEEEWQIITVNVNANISHNYY